jgi:hypothetical protein
MCVRAVGYAYNDDSNNRYWAGYKPGFDWFKYWSAVQFYGSFALFFIPFAFVVGLFLFVIVQGAILGRVPGIAVRAIAILCATVGTGWIVIGVGWYANLPASAMYFAILLGFVFGTCVYEIGGRLEQKASNL